MTNYFRKGFDWLEARKQGAFRQVMEQALARGGVVHAAPDCLLMAAPCPDAPDTLEVLFQCSHLPALRAVLLALPYERVRWRRDLRRGNEIDDRYGWHERAVADFCRHYGFGVFKKD